jgi:hypothetical protein
MFTQIDMKSFPFLQLFHILLIAIGHWPRVRPCINHQEPGRRKMSRRRLTNILIRNQVMLFAPMLIQFLRPIDDDLLLHGMFVNDIPHKMTQLQIHHVDLDFTQNIFQSIRLCSLIGLSEKSTESSPIIPFHFIKFHSISFNFIQFDSI